jgi:predicted nucleic acid-binding protein
MRGSFFLDSNVVLYGFSGREPDKQLVARELAESEGAWVSTQVLSEVGAILIRTFGFPVGEARARVASIAAACDVVVMTPPLILDAFRIAERYRIGLYDAQIVAAALACGATRLYSEDLHDGLVVDGLAIVSPFRTRAGEPAARYVTRPRARPRRPGSRPAYA